MTATHVFAGPSLDVGQIRALLPDAVPHPPVAHLDLMRLPVRAGARVVLLDGVFQQAASVRHKEILDLLGRGVAVYGAASMGALRAAELGPFGMVGSGVVYRLYASGVLDADDEVALVHDHLDHDGGRWVARTVALVSVRMLAARLRRRGVLSAAARDALVAAARELHFTRRSWPALLDLARRNGLDGAAAAAVREVVRRPAPEWDVKSRDAVAILRRLARRPTTPAPAAGSAATSVAGSAAGPVGGASWPVTGFLARWRHPPDGDLSLRVTAAALWATDFPALYRRVVVAALGDPVAAAVARGIVPDTDLDGLHAAFRAWLGPEERFAARDALLTTVLVRSYRWAPDVAPLPLVYDALREASGFAELCRLVDEAREINTVLATRGFPVERASTATLHSFCAARWGVRDLAPARFDRGFTTLDDLHRRSRPLVAFSRLRLGDRELLLA